MFAGNETVAMLSRVAKRVHLGLHTEWHHPEWDVQLRDKFVEHGWRVQWFFSKSDATVVRNNTPFGPVTFGDGVLSMVNLNPPAACKRGHAR